jgi:hypothetical protein
MSDLDNQILIRARATPGVQQSDIVRALMGSWSPAYVRERIKVLEARRELRTARDGGNRILLYPSEAIAV